MPHACPICGQPVAEGRPTRTCSARCRVAQWRQGRATETAATVAQLQTENQTLRQRVRELELLIGKLKDRWTRR
jgi:predicted nucleic acid-binding Zn ribbon protein